MYTVDVIKDGYSYFKEKQKVDRSELECMKANATSTLVKGSKCNVLVDTLTAWDGEFIQQELRKRNLNCDDITHVVCTHGHSDHIGNLNLFLKAVHIVGQSVSFKDEYMLHPFNKDIPYVIAENLEVIPTPGHTLSDVSLIVKDTSLGVVAVVGDLFEKEEDIQDPSIWREAGSENPELQIANREKILKSANYIIPGHGAMFKVTNSHINIHAKYANENK